MRRSRSLIYITLLTCLILAGCQLAPDNEPAPTQTTETPLERPPLLVEQQETMATVYYTTTDHKWLVPLTIPINATREVARVAVEKLLSGAPNDFVGTVIPAETKLRYLYISDHVVYLDLTKDFLDIDPPDAGLALSSLCATVLPAAGDYSLQLLVGGEPCPSIGDIDTSKPLDSAPLNLASETSEGIAAVYYFCDQQAMYLVPQTMLFSPDEVNAAADPSQFLAQKIMENLLQGPDPASGLSRTIWPGTKLLAVSVKDGVATVDLSAEVLGYGGGAAAEQCLTNSLLYSLTSLSGVTSVQLMINGEKQEYLPEGTDISQPLVKEAPLNLLN